MGDVSALFPRVPSHVQWYRDAASLLDPSSGVRVAASGAIGFVTATPAPVIARPGSLAALLGVAPLAAAAPLWAGARLSPLSRALGAGLAVVLAVVLLHAVASGRVPAFALALAALPLAAQCVVGRRQRPPVQVQNGGRWA